MKESSTPWLKKRNASRSPTTCVDTKRRSKGERSRKLAKPRRSTSVISMRLLGKAMTPSASSKSPMLELRKRLAREQETRREDKKSDAASAKTSSSKRLKRLSRIKRKTTILNWTPTLVVIVRLRDWQEHSRKSSIARIKNVSDLKRSKSAIHVSGSSAMKKRDRKLRMTLTDR